MDRLDNLSSPIIEVSNLTVAYGDVAVLWKVNISIDRGNMTAIIGPNGAGKSTLVKAMVGIIDSTEGKISFDGKTLDELSNRHEKIAYMPQRGSVDWDFPTTVLDVVMMGRYGHLGWFRRPGKEEKEIALNALKRFGMAEFVDRQINELSGGQKQRVFLARTYVQDAEIIFLDEPFGGIDITTENIILSLLRELSEEGKTIVVITHDLSSLKQHFDTTILLNIHNIASGSPDEVLTRENLEHCYGGTLHAVNVSEDQ